MKNTKTSIIFDSIHQLGEKIQQHGNYSHVFVLVDEHTKKYCFPLLLEQQNFFSEADIIEIPVGEESKSIEIVYQIWGSLLESGADRKSLLVNLGGGVITDLGGFVASTFKRGIDFINVPTTLMGQVDAAIGGKTGINFEDVKNQIGTFSPPLFTYIDSIFLQTLPERELRSGLAEIIKYSLTLNKELIPLITNDWKSHLPQLIANCAQLKKELIEEDFTEKGNRKKLNFGHTIGHALESLFIGELTHGEAIAQGIKIEAVLSQKYGTLPENEVKSIHDLIDSFYEPIVLQYADLPAMIEAMLKDKKNKDGNINFTFLNEIGESTIDHYLEKEIVMEVLSSMVK